MAMVGDFLHHTEFVFDLFIDAILRGKNELD